MDMSSMTMAAATGTATAAAAAASSSMPAMDMDMGMGGCKISMLWNWNTIDTCFISTSWHVRSTSMFAGSCIGVTLLVILLEFLRRTGKEYDRHILRQHQRTQLALQQSASGPGSLSDGKNAMACNVTPLGSMGMAPFRPNVIQQAVRALLHMVQFAVAYFVMLLAMYYNGYFIICIFLGSFIGAFVFSWETILLGDNKEEVTVCCG